MRIPMNEVKTENNNCMEISAADSAASKPNTLHQQAPEDRQHHTAQNECASAPTPALAPAPTPPPATAQASKPAGPTRELLLSPVTRRFPYFMGLSLAFGAVYTFCLYENPAGITYPLFTAFACLCGYLACKGLQVPMKRESFFLMAAAVLIGIGTCRTSEWFLIRMNGIALVLLGVVFGIHQFYDDKTWNMGKYFCSIAIYLCQALETLPYPFRHACSYIKNQENKTMKKISFFFIGFLMAIPMLAVLIALLGAADAVFSNLVHELLGKLLKPATIFSILFQFLFGVLALYCLICGCCLHGLKPDAANRQKGEPAIAFACMSTISAVYLLFCGIQVVYLFMGKGNLPEGYTFSSYARQGFFQLLLVAFLNLIMVLCCLKYIRPNKALNVVLTLICICTYVMIASAWYRMMLYVGEYHLTYLRLIVLWFLAMLSILMIGVTLIIWKTKFPLFSYSLAVVSLFYIALVWAKPGSVVAWDYVNHMDKNHITDDDFFFLYYELSADAAPAVSTLDFDGNLSPGLDYSAQLGNYYFVHSNKYCRELGIRNYNFALAEARKLFPAFHNTGY